MKKLRITLLIISLLIISASFIWYSFKKTGFPESGMAIPTDNPPSSVEIPVSITFAGEPVPLQYFDVRESLDRELLINTYWHSQTILFLKKSKRFFAVIEPILAKNNIPDDLKYIVVAESGFLNLVSPAGAVGFWQILEPTAKENGLEVNAYIDQRYNLEKATETACKILLKSYSLYHSWTLAAAAYNMGRNAINKQIKRQKSGNYYDLVLGEETGRYVYRLVAFKIVMENPSKYGFNLSENDYYPVIPQKVISIDSTITDLAQWAIDMKINYKILKIYNPWLRDNVLPNKSRKTYSISVPAINLRDNINTGLLDIDTNSLNQ